MKKVIEWIRVSREMRPFEDRFNISAQRTVNRCTAKRYGLTIVRSIELTNVSGTAVLKTPEMQVLLRLICDPEIEGVVVREFSRLMRPGSFIDYVLFHAFQESGTLVYLPEDAIDFRTTSGRLMGAVRAAVAGLEHNDQQERAWAGKEVMRRAGKHPNGHISLPLGVGYDKSGQWFYTPEARKIKQAFRLFLAGQTNYQTLSRQLGFRDRTLPRILRNPIYCGWRIIDERYDPSPFAIRTRADGRQAPRPKIKRTPDQVIRVKVISKPLISEGEFNRVQSIAKLKKQTDWCYHPNVKASCTFAGFLRCGACGGRLHNASSNSSQKYYVCKNRREKHGCEAKCQRRDRLQWAANSLFNKQITDQMFLRHIIALSQKSHEGESKKCTNRLRANLDRLKEKRERILELAQARLISPHERNQHVNAVDRDLDRAIEALLQRPTATLSRRQLTALFRPLAGWKTASPEQQRAILFANIAAIHVANHKILGLSMHANINQSAGTSIPASMMPFTKIRGCRVLHIRLT